MCPTFGGVSKAGRPKVLLSFKSTKELIGQERLPLTCQRYLLLHLLRYSLVIRVCKKIVVWSMGRPLRGKHDLKIPMAWYRGVACLCRSNRINFFVWFNPEYPHLKHWLQKPLEILNPTSPSGTQPHDLANKIRHCYQFHVVGRRIEAVLQMLLCISGVRIQLRRKCPGEGWYEKMCKTVIETCRSVLSRTRDQHKC